MESELPSQRHCLEGLTPQTSGMLKRGKSTFRLDLKQHFAKQMFAKIVSKKADISTTGLKTKNFP